ncbi:MAG: hypothetical protein V2G41_09945, partial [bacterium JZ-2024 1]
MPDSGRVQAVTMIATSGLSSLTARRVRCDQDGYLYVRSIKNQGEVAGAADSGFQVLGIRRDDD